MSTEASGATEGAAKAGSGGSGSKLNGTVLVLLVNAVVSLAVIGLMVYTRLMFKKPVITESAERVRLTETKKVVSNDDGTRELMPFEPITVNIRARTSPDAKENALGKMHYVTLGFALELRDAKYRAKIDDLKPKVLDRLLSLIGRKDYFDLVTVQGRYVLRTQIAEITNDLVQNHLGKNDEIVVTNVYFTHFMAQ